MLPNVVASLVRLLMPGAPGWVFFLLEALDAAFEIVELLQDSDAEKAAKFQIAAQLVGEALDEALDDLPEWSEISERRRDTIIAGLVEFAVFISETADRSRRTTRRRLRRAVRAAARS